MDIVGFFMELFGENWLAQWIGVVATLLSFIGYLSKNSKGIFLYQIITNAIWAIHLLMIGAYTGMMLNVCGFIRSLVLFFDNKKWAKSKWSNISMTVMMAVAGVVSGLFSMKSETPGTLRYYIWILPTIAMVIGTPLLCTRKAMVVRVSQFCVISPLWMVHNYVMSSVGGVIAEILNMVSVGSSIIRYRKMVKNMPKKV